MLNILLTLLLFTTGLVSAQTQTNIVYPTRASSGASTLQTGFGYKYMGCYNETNTIAGSGGARALSQSGTNTATNIMDVGTCLNFCGGSKFAGLEYGRECYCSPYLSSLSVQLNDSRCDFQCNGNGTQICGGEGAISLYTKTSAGSIANGRQGLQEGAWWYMAAAVGMAMWAAWL
ncbi:WSC-domain-containing protein [Dissoconium aciculare CBS 342.82]|uniref:WSC-domain-containing protein n=1 Tax=Dissoconium aciculare CBS 342.82 TaxID=1314786 RepID=A0A6J3LS95_9PEZI|nr:WSC-domain-containing protein [Dissoconium aciculare CBS 342.82]KAF1818503.1 WSC-domain-containing protein [Dissoconium aciculare CBS 342.82]